MAELKAGSWKAFSWAIIWSMSRGASPMGLKLGDEVMVAMLLFPVAQRAFAYFVARYVFFLDSRSVLAVKRERLVGGFGVG